MDFGLKVLLPHLELACYFSPYFDVQVYYKVVLDYVVLVVFSSVKLRG